MHKLDTSINTSHRRILKTVAIKGWQIVDQDRLSQLEKILQNQSQEHEDLAELRYETTLYEVSLSFYSGWTLLAVINDKGYGPAVRFALIPPSNKEQPIILDWSVAPITQANHVAHLVLNKLTIKDYLQFWLSFVKGPHGRFSLVEQGRDFNWVLGSKAGTKSKAIGNTTPVQITERPDGGFTAEACVVFLKTLVKTTIQISNMGVLDIGPPTPLTESLPVEDDIFFY